MRTTISFNAARKILLRVATVAAGCDQARNGVSIEERCRNLLSGAALHLLHRSLGLGLALEHHTGLIHHNHALGCRLLLHDRTRLFCRGLADVEVGASW